MSCRKLRRIFVAFSLLLVATLPGLAAAAKLDPALIMLTHNLAAQKTLDPTMSKSINIIKAAPSRVLAAQGVAEEAAVGTLVRFKGNLDGVAALGAKIRSIIGDIATVDIPLSQVSRVAQLPNIVYIEAAKAMRPMLNTSVALTGANTGRSGTPPNYYGYTGRGVVVGMVDSGIDLSHEDFKDALGKTRIVALWDQNLTGTPPAGKNYGHECTQAAINAGGCTHTDTSGHGTHVAGIAAGNGKATGNGQAAYRYIGMAPEADLVVVRYQSSLNTPTWQNNVLDGIAYIQAKAAALGKPSVINISLGTHYDPHDGTANYARGLNNASGAGKVIVLAAGNEAGAGIHASGNVAQGGSQTTVFNFVAPPQSPNALPLISLDIWYAGANQMGVQVSKPNQPSCTTAAVNPGDAPYDLQTACGRIQISSSMVNPNNGDREIAILMGDGTNPLAAGNWHVQLSGISVTGNGRFDLWSEFDQRYADTLGVTTFPTNPDTSMTLGDGASAAKVISVGSFVSKPATGETTGSISSFSSLGPRRPCSLTSECPVVQKPDIAAPGGGIYSAFSQSSTRGTMDADGVHVIKSGTSMAAPHVTGAVALLLQIAPTLTSDRIKTLLNTNVNTTGTGTVPNNTWGYGKLAVNNAANALPVSAARANAGANQLVSPNVTTSLTFTNVTAAGVTTILPTAAPDLANFVAAAGGMPAGTTASYGYDISTTATFTGTIDVCLNLPGTINATDFATLRLYHGEIGVLVDRTIMTGAKAPDFATRRLCAQVSSLSPFVVGIATPAPAPTPASGGGGGGGGCSVGGRAENADPLLLLMLAMSLLYVGRRRVLCAKIE